MRKPIRQELIVSPEAFTRYVWENQFVGAAPDRIHHGLELLRRVSKAGDEIPPPAISTILTSGLRLPPHDGGAFERGVAAVAKMEAESPAPGKRTADTLKSP